MAKTEQAPKNYFVYHLRVLRLLGLDILGIKNPFYRILYNIYAFVFIIFTFVGFTILEFLSFYENHKNLDLGTYILCFWLSHFMGCIKAALCLINHKNIKKYLMSFEEGIFIPNTKRGADEINIIKKAIKFANGQATVFYVLATVVIINGVTYAVRDPGIVKTIQEPQMNTSSIVLVRTLPWNSWFWFDTTPTPNYELAFFYQVWCISIFGVEVGILDALVTGMLVHLNAQFTILKNAVLSIADRAKKMKIAECAAVQFETGNNNVYCGESNADESVGRGWENVPRLDPTMAKYMNLCMADCLEHHNKIIDLSNNVEEQFNMIVLIQFLGSTLIFCFQIFQLSFMAFPSLKFVSLTFYLALMLFQLTIYCYNGNEISRQSEEISQAAYSTDWYGADDSLKKSLILMMLRAQRPIRISAGKFAFLSLETLMNIIRGSVSYYMVLHQKNG